MQPRCCVSSTSTRTRPSSPPNDGAGKEDQAPPEPKIHDHPCPLRAHHLPLGHRAQPHRRLADVPVQRHRRAGRRLARPAPGRESRRWRRHRVHRGNACLGGRTHHRSLPRPVERAPPGAARAASPAIITRCGAVPGIQLAHAGRKASVQSPLGGRRADLARRRRLGPARRQARSRSLPAQPIRRC